jgi:RNA polymerase sigma-70 factor (ECF subfamily)
MSAVGAVDTRSVAHRRASLIDRARRGDRDALGELWRAHNSSVVRYLVARRTRSAEDVASQVWTDVAGSLSRFEGDEDDFRRWLFTIAHRRGVDAIRRSVRDDEIAVRAADAVEMSRGADEEFDRSDALDRALALIAGLPDDMGAAVMLRLVNDLDVSDIAEILGTSEGNVRVLVHRGVARLRRKLAVTPTGSSTMKVVP